MSALWTEKQAAIATNGKAIGNWSASGLSIDSRTILAGELFIPLKDIRDGHDFIPMALNKGAGAVMSERDIADIPALKVDNIMQALENMARFARQRSKALRIAVTGSVGKTSVKEMLAHILAEFDEVHKSKKSFNNHWGVPLTLANMPIATKYGIFEAGMNHKGELEKLADIIAPHIAIITKIAPAHLAHFKNVEEIAKAKAEIFSHMSLNAHPCLQSGSGNSGSGNSGSGNSGIIILPADSPHYNLLRKLANSLTNKAKVLSFGRGEHADAKIIKTSFDANGSKASLSILGEEIELVLNVLGAHWLENATLVLLVVKLLGLDLNRATQALQNMPEIKGRGQVSKINYAGKNISIIDESYNANPESMRASLSALGLAKGRRVAILGDMLELGDDEDLLHANLAEIIAKNKINMLVTCGPLMKNLHKNMADNLEKYWFENADECFSQLPNIIKEDDIIMIKGSNASGMGELVNKIIHHSQKQSQNQSQVKGEKANAI